ncbi:MAG: hypothetical protein AAGF53_04250 [Pseudomonadota bacterium]
MSLWLTLIAILISLAGISYFASTDNRRRSIHRMPQIERRRFAWLARLFTFAPGIVLLLSTNWSGLSIWAGAVMVLGWNIAALTPKNYSDLKQFILSSKAQLTQSAKTLKNRFAGREPWPDGVTYTLIEKATKRRTINAEVSQLEARIVALEARLHRLESEKAELVDVIQPEAKRTKQSD